MPGHRSHDYNPRGNPRGNPKGKPTGIPARRPAGFALIPLLASGLAGSLASGVVSAQVPVDEYGEAYATYDAVPAPPTGTGDVATASIEMIGEDAIPLLPAREVEELVGPVALYPDQLLAIVLPAAAYPLQIVQAARFLEELEADPTLTPSPDWDESVVALLNYPEVLQLLNDDIDWTLRLGEAVIAQQSDVIAAVQRFRDRAYLAGNLRSDGHQNIVRADEIIEITPVSESTIYVPVYKPESVVQHSVHPVYTYYPDPYPVYYYPYPDGHAFRNGYFWGVTSAYALGWRHDGLRVIHHSFSGHPYFGHRYGWRWWYRRPTLVYHNNTYYRPNRPNRTIVRSQVGDYWIPRHMRRTWWADNRIRAYRDGRATYTTEGRLRAEISPRQRTTQRPTMGSVERSLREQGTRRSDRVMTPARPSTATRTPARTTPRTIAETSNRRSLSPATSLPSQSQRQSQRQSQLRTRTITPGRSSVPELSNRSSSPPTYRRNEPSRVPRSIGSGSSSKFGTRPAPASRSASPPRAPNASTRAPTRSSSSQPQSSRRSVTTQSDSRSRRRH